MSNQDLRDFPPRIRYIIETLVVPLLIAIVSALIVAWLQHLH